MWALADPELNGYVGSAGTVGEAWPHLQQVCRLERQRVVKGKKQVAVSYAISSLPATDADARRLLSLSRGHWGIENRLHWVRDVTFDENLQDPDTRYGGYCLHCRREITATGSVEWRRVVRRPCPHCGAKGW